MAGKQSCPNPRCTYMAVGKQMDKHIQRTRHGMAIKASKAHNANFKGVKKKKEG